MSEVSEGKIQLSDKANGTLINVRAETVDELAEIVDGLIEKGDDIVTKFSSFKELWIAKGILTQSDRGGNFSKGAANGPESSVGSSESSGGTPSCKHGPMKDLRGRGYKSDFYCTEKDRDAQCKAVKL